MKVVLDSNIIIADYNFNKPAARILLEQAKNEMLNVHVPEIVLDEVINKFRERFEKAQKSIGSEIDTINGLNLGELKSPMTGKFVDDATESYRKRLENLFRDHNIEIMGYPDTDHKYLAKKAMLKRKPFNTHEKGYRDNLIWENVKSLVLGKNRANAPIPDVVFITDNTSDFLTETGLHADLIAELEEEGLQSSTIVVFRKLQDFNDQIMKFHFAQADQFMALLRGNSNFEIIRELIANYLHENFVGAELSAFEFVDPRDFYSDEREISGFEEDFRMQILEVRKLSHDQFVIDIRVDIETELEFFINKSEHFTSHSESYVVVNFDWNDHVMLVRESQNIPFSVTLIVNSDLESQSIEMNKIDED